MRKFLLIGSLAMLMMGAAAPLALAHDQDRAGGDGQALRVVGLTADGRLVAFRSENTRRSAASARSPGWQTTSRWSASTTAFRTASCTAWGTRAGSTP